MDGTEAVPAHSACQRGRNVFPFMESTGDALEGGGGPGRPAYAQPLSP